MGIAGGVKLGKDVRSVSGVSNAKAPYNFQQQMVVLRDTTYLKI